MKYVDSVIVFDEIPDEITLAISISGCTIRCKDCHSKYLWDDSGTELDSSAVDTMIKCNQGISCICFMGGKFNDLKPMLKHIRNNCKLKIAWYSGESEFPLDYSFLELLDFIKIGPYISERGGLDNPKTNQRMYSISEDNLGRRVCTDITYKFRKPNETENICKTV